MITIYTIGDSIMQTNKADTYPQTGWAQMLNLFVNENVQVINLAKNGTSTKSFLEQGRFEYVKNNIKENDLLVIGFAHNDEKINDPLRYTRPFNEFKENLSYFIDVAKSKKANVILTTPVIRRKFVEHKLVDTHLDYVKAINEFKENNICDVIDLNKLTTLFFEKIGEDLSKRYFMNFDKGIYDNYPLGQHDDSHLRYNGAYLVAKLFVNEIYRLNLSIKSLFMNIENNLLNANDSLEK